MYSCVLYTILRFSNILKIGLYHFEPLLFMQIKDTATKLPPLIEGALKDMTVIYDSTILIYTSNLPFAICTYLQLIATQSYPFGLGQEKVAMQRK